MKQIRDEDFEQVSVSASTPLLIAVLLLLEWLHARKIVYDDQEQASSERKNEAK